MNPEVLSKEDNARVLGFLKHVAKEAEGVNLTQTAIMAGRLLTEYDGQSLDRMFDRINFLADLFHQESESIKFFLVKPERLKFYENTELAGEQYKSAFPRGNTELIEAGNCLTFDHHTACVFHLMRALEYGLRAVAFGLGLPEPTKGNDRNWGNMLGTIKAKIDTNNSALRADVKWQGEKGFYEKAYAFLEGVRNPIRNSTMHVESDYDEQGAIDVLNACSAFMRHIATKLVE